jgi:hypothetical protein
MKKRPVALVVLLVVAAIAWKMWQLDAPTTAIAPRQPTTVADVTLPPASVLAVRPDSSTAATQHDARSPLAAIKRPVSNDMAQFRARKDFAALNARLRGQAATPESLYLQAAIYARCAHTGATLSLEARVAKREQFIASISQGNKDQTLRIAAYDRMTEDPCEGVDPVEFDASRLQSMLIAASEAGDVRARAWLVADEIEHRTPSEIGTPTHGDSMTVDNFESLRSLLATADAETIMYLRGSLSSTLDHGEIRLDGESFDPMAMHTALQLLACDAGAECGPDSPPLVEACAMRGRCGASNVYDYAYFYGQSPSDSQLVDSYRQSLGHMILNGNLSELTLSPLDPPADYIFQFGDSRP